MKKEMIAVSNEEKIKLYRQKSIEELEEILNDPNSTESDIIIASIEQQHKEEELGIAEYFTTEEVMEYIYEQARMVMESRTRYNSDL